MSPAIEDFLKIADAYISGASFKVGTNPETTTSWRLFDDGKVLGMLRPTTAADGTVRDGAGITLARLEKATQWFSDNWPPKTRWPKGVKRPAKTVVAEKVE